MALVVRYGSADRGPVNLHAARGQPGVAEVRLVFYKPLESADVRSSRTLPPVEVVPLTVFLARRES